MIVAWIIVAMSAASDAALALAALWPRSKQRQRRAEYARRPPFRAPPPDPNILTIRGFEFYVRLDPERSAEMVDSTRGMVRSLGTVYLEPTHAVVAWSDFNPPEDLLQRISAKLDTEVIWLGFQKTVDALDYQRWNGGSLPRRLTFGCYERERTWEQVDGTPEDWEAGAIFNESRL